MKAAEKNLYEFYKALTEAKTVTNTNLSNCSIVSEENGNWPQMGYRIKSSKTNLNKVFDTINEIKYTKYVIANSQLFKQKNLIELRNKNIYPIATWELMEISLPVQINNYQTSNLFIKEILSGQDILAFTTLVNNELPGNIKVEKSLLATIFRNPNINLFGIYNGDEIVTTLMSFTHKKNAGLYFIATKKTYRGKGLAQELIGYVFNFLSRHGVQKAVLQSVQKAVPLYTNLGFSSNGKLIIFSKIKT